jgi:hypothetical protein
MAKKRKKIITKVIKQTAKADIETIKAEYRKIKKIEEPKKKDLILILDKNHISQVSKIP